MGSSDTDSNNQMYKCHLYQQVSNTADLRKHIFAQSLPVILINPKLIVDEFQVQMAIFKAQCNLDQNRLKTKIFQTEILYCLSPSKNITESLKLFSCVDEDVDLLVVAQDSAFESFKGMIKGSEIDMNQLNTVTNTDLVLNTYQITLEELKKSSLVDSIVSRMASKEYYSVTAAN